jgi:hypothetical protein
LLKSLERQIFRNGGSRNLISCAMHVVELSYVSCHLILTHLLSATFTLYYLCTHFTHTHTIVFLCMGISDSDALLMNTQKKRQKSLQCSLRISTKRFSALKGVVSADGDSKRSSAVDDLNCHTQPSQVLGLTSRCQIWLHVAYGV